ncbi:hypothetical protein [Faecalispora anaeroviscerum]|uniref:hypothetical protein n=1 Tax=Faecalispora anaeroviscerum TaxID=2991836 RepID=UPI0024BB8742|nr:hypothetical protein [Faecalispora anaeroviscerum]
MPEQNTVKVGIGFATGRKSFRKVLKTNILNWRECGLTQNRNISLNVFVAYDLKYEGTKVTDYTNIPPNLLNELDGAFFLGEIAINREKRDLVRKGILSAEQASLFFEGGYAGKRNALLYWAMKNHMDYLLFLDDDEYPMAVTNTRNWAVWSGQHILLSHLQQMQNTGANITHGHHCGYISPIPSLEFNSTLTKEDFRSFIEAISNDIVNWDTHERVMKQGGVTYADTAILTSNEPQEVLSVNKCKFISGSNLCINLKDSARVYPFYNPPGARGEDTFLSTLLADCKVLRIPYYTFHDGFSAYNHLMDGVLPIRLKPVCGDLDVVVDRFYRACVGWVRYKPLLLYITQRDTYESRIQQMREQLAATLPKLSAYFGRSDFLNISNELEQYHSSVESHFQQFQQTLQIWRKLVFYLETEPKMQSISALTVNPQTADSLPSAL